MWSIALCDTGEPTPHGDEIANITTSTATNGRKKSNHVRGNGPRRGSSPHRVTILDDPVVGRTKTTTATQLAASDNNNDSDGSVLKGPGQRQGARNSVGGAPASILAAGRSNANLTPDFAAADGGTAVVEAKTVAMPHQRHGHTCFVWDPRDTARTSGDAVTDGEGSAGGGGKGSSVSTKREHSNVSTNSFYIQCTTRGLFPRIEW